MEELYQQALAAYAAWLALEGRRVAMESFRGEETPEQAEERTDARYQHDTLERAWLAQCSGELIDRG